MLSQLQERIMIDLNLKPKQEQEEPVGMIIIYFLPIVLVFFALLIRGL